MGKVISEYPNYIIEPDGRIYSKFYKKWLKPSLTKKTGYYSVELHNSQGYKRLTVHRLVAQAFIENPHNYPCVNHKDEDKANNRVENLEWCTHKYNANYGTKIQRYKAHRVYDKEFMKKLHKLGYEASCKAVCQYDLEGNLINSFESVTAAERYLGIRNSNIGTCCNGKENRKTSHGFIWKWKE